MGSGLGAACALAPIKINGIQTTDQQNWNIVALTTKPTGNFAFREVRTIKPNILSNTKPTCREAQPTTANATLNG